ncbi:MAG: glycosyltransferase family 4 protein, partial [Clostridia bacterium]|nr:glycosyltransferase family 4 protein [Clostridia bacterium]
MRVLHVLRPAAGGMRRHVLDLAGDQRVAGLNVAVAGPGDDAWAARFREVGVAYWPLTVPGSPSPVGLVAAARELARLIVHLDPHLVHAHGATAAAVARLAPLRPPRPVVYTLHGLPPAPAAAWLQGLWERRLAGRTAAYIAVSEAVAEAWERLWRLPHGYVHRVRNGVDLTACAAGPSRAEARAALGLDPDAEWVGTAGRLSPEKGIDVFLRAMAAVSRRRPRCRFAVAGDGPERHRLERLAARLGLASLCRFTGWLPELATLLAALDVFVLPSRREGLPLTLLEAMASGRPVVAAAVGGVTEAVCHGASGYLVPPGAPEALAAAVVRILEAPRERERLGAGARQAAARFDRARATAETLAIY